MEDIDIKYEYEIGQIVGIGFGNESTPAVVLNRYDDTDVGYLYDFGIIVQSKYCEFPTMLVQKRRMLGRFVVKAAFTCKEIDAIIPALVLLSKISSSDEPDIPNKLMCRHIDGCTAQIEFNKDKK